MPPETEEWLAERRRGPLPPDAVVRYERISRGKGTSSDGTVTVGGDGRVDASGPAYRKAGLTGVLSRRNRLKLSQAEMAALRVTLAAIDGDPPYQRDHRSKGGDWEIVTRAGASPESVIFENADREVLAHLRDLARRADPGTRG